MDFKQATIFLTERCNFNCYHCYVKKDLKKNIRIETFEWIVENFLERFQIDKINLIGGEPFLYPQIDKVLDILENNRNIKVGITTNGSVLNTKILKKLKSINLSKLKVSFHSLDDIVFDKLTRTSGKKDMVLKNIHRLIKIFPISINITATKLNSKEIPKTIDFFVKMGITSFHISQLTIAGNAVGSKEERLSSEEIMELKVKLNTQFSKNIPVNIEYDDDKFCSFGSSLSISPLGDVFACVAMVSYPEFRVGTIDSSRKEIETNIDKLLKQKTRKCFIEQHVF